MAKKILSRTIHFVFDNYVAIRGKHRFVDSVERYCSHGNILTNSFERDLHCFDCNVMFQNKCHHKIPISKPMSMTKVSLTFTLQGLMQRCLGQIPNTPYPVRKKSTKPLSIPKNKFNGAKTEVKQSTLASILKCSDDFLLDLLAQHPRFQSFPLDKVEEKVKLCESFDLPITLIQQYPRFLYQTSCEELSKRLQLLNEQGLLEDLLTNQVVLKPSHFGHYLECSNSKFSAGFQDLCRNQSAVHGYAGQFLSHEKLKDFNISPSLIEEKVKIFLSFGLPIDIIHKYPGFLYNTSSQEILRRLQLLNEKGLLKDLMGHQAVLKAVHFGNFLQQANSVFLTRYKNLCKQQDALEGCANQRDYLQFRLKTTSAIASKLVDSHALGKGYSNHNLKEHLDFFLLEANISEIFIIDNIDLFRYSVDRLRSRYLYLKTNCDDSPSETLLNHVWRLSQKKFDIGYFKIK